MVNTSSKHLTFKSSTPQGTPRVVVLVSKKVATLAVHRNKIKRRLREIIRSISPLTLNGVLYTRKGVNELSFKELQAEVEDLLRRID